MVASNFQLGAAGTLPSPDDVASLTQKVLQAAALHGCTPQKVPARTVVLPPASTTSPLFVLLDGVMGAVVHSGKRRMTLHAFVEGDAFASMEAFAQGDPSLYGIEALTPAEYVEIPRPLVERMARESADVSRWVLIHHRRWIIRMSQRIVTLAAASPAARYRHFARMHPDLMLRLPQYEIASILGISPESLSRVRRRLSQKPRV
jgi:CRP-like cAMP-binding protein